VILLPGFDIRVMLVSWNKLRSRGLGVYKLAYINFTKEFHCVISIHVPQKCSFESFLHNFISPFYTILMGFIILFSNMHIKYFDHIHPLLSSSTLSPTSSPWNSPAFNFLSFPPPAPFFRYRFYNLILFYG
jgi:hypothetical protein